MRDRNFFSELKRRNVYKVAVAYAVVSWLVLQAASLLFGTFDAPSWAMKIFVIAVALGLPIALVLAWAFEITAEGIKREEEVEADKSISRHTGRRIVGITVLVAAVAAGLMVFQLLRPKSHGSMESGAPATPNERGLVGAQPSIPEKSIAVLPFDNLSDDKSNAYFAEGVQDEILSRLAKVADLKVISRTSTQRINSSPTNLPDIAKQLGVAHIVEGSVQKSGDAVRVSVQLINALTDAHLWAEIYDRKLTDIFAVESDVAKTIADTLQAKLTGSEKTAMARAPTTNPEAYQLYLQGRFFWNKRTAPDLRKSIDYFNQAIAKDSQYALAYAGAAESWVLLPAYDGGSPLECFPQAEMAAKKALAIDETSSGAYTALGATKSCLAFDFTGAINDFERAIKLNPNDSTAHHWLGNHPLTCLGQMDRAMAEMKRAQELDPLSLIINTNIGYTSMFSGRYDEAITQLRKTLDLDGNFYFAHYTLGTALELKGSIPEAIAEYQKAAELSTDLAPLGYLGHIYAKIGRRNEAEQILNRLLEARKQRYTQAYFIGLVYLGLGDRAEALHYFEQSYNDHDAYNIGLIRLDPLLKELHGDPRFEALAQKILPARLFTAKSQ